MTRSLFAPLLSLLLLVAVPVVVSGCTCNEASNPAARGQGRAGKAKMKMKMKRKRKGKRKVDIPRVAVGLYYIDTNKLEAGDEDPWVRVERQVGAKTPAKNAVWQLLKGPGPKEQSDGLTLMKSGSDGFQNFAIEGTTATLSLRGGCDSGGSTITVYDHIEKTLKAFPEIEHVKLLDAEGNTQNPDGEGDSRPACLEP
jgi:Fe-S cluster biogenesis protein NfuA